MRYKLFREKPLNEEDYVVSTNDNSSLGRILWNRHIEDANTNDFLHIQNKSNFFKNEWSYENVWLKSKDEDTFISYLLLDNIIKAGKCILKHCDNNNIIAIVVDCD